MPATDVELLLVGGGVSLATQMVTSLLASRQATQTAAAESRRLQQQVQRDDAVSIEPLVETLGLRLSDVMRELSRIGFSGPEDGRLEEALDVIEEVQPALVPLQMRLSTTHPLTVAAQSCLRGALHYLRATGAVEGDGHAESPERMEEAMVLVRRAHQAYFEFASRIIGPSFPIEHNATDTERLRELEELVDSANESALRSLAIAEPETTTPEPI